MKHLIKVLGYARNLWPYYVGVTFFTVLMSLSALAIPFVIKAATDLVVRSIQTGQPDVAGAIFFALMLLVVDIFGTIVTNIGGYFGDVMSAKMKKQLSERYYTHLLKLPQGYYDKELTGTIINRLNRTIFEVTQFMNAFANNFFQMLLTVVLTIIIIWTYSWELAILILILYPLFMWLTTLTSKKWQHWQDAKNHETDLASGRFAEVISQIRVVKSFVQENLEFRHFERKFQNTINITYQQSRYWHSMDVIRRTVLNIIFFAIFAYLFVNTVEERFTIGEMVLLIQLIGLVRMPIFSMSFLVDQTQKAISGCRDYFRVMETKPGIIDKSHAPALEVTRGEVKFDTVTFGYNDGETVLDRVSFVVNPGEKIALVGESGQGKTTITSLLMRLYEPDKGDIMIDDISIASVRQTSLRDAIAAVFQDAALFSGTVRENISYAKPHATEAQIIKAAKAANAYDFIKTLPSGFDTEIGERGLKLSGGQKQRIAIARAILKDAPILVLDEATSSLDSKAEKLVQEALSRLMEGRTTLIIAHRLSTIAHVDRIITLKGGRIDEEGTPEQLAATGGIYSELLALQADTPEIAKKRLKKFDISGY